MKLNAYIVSKSTGERSASGTHDFPSRESILSFSGLISHQTDGEACVEFETEDGEGIEKVWGKLPVLNCDVQN